LDYSSSSGNGDYQGRQVANQTKTRQREAAASQWIKSGLRQRICDPAIAMIVMAPASASHHHIAR
jgi:hypothetical protein